MIARITKILLLLQFLIAAAIFTVLTKVFGIGNEFGALLLSIGFILLLRLGIMANNFLLAAHYRSVLPDRYRIGWWQMCRLFGGELKASMMSSSWTMPFHAFSRRAARHPEGFPVLLIHGYGCNSGYWHAMSKALFKANITHHAIDMEPVAGGIDEYVSMIHEAVERLCVETGCDRIVIVAHSMGGLATRAYLRDHGSGRVAKVVTLGTPHHGTALAYFGIGLNTHQMRWTATGQEGLSSEWLSRLATEEDERVYRLFVSIYSHHDNIISPQTSSYLQGAKNIEFHAIGHVALALDPVIQAQVIREVRSASRQVAAACRAA